LGDVKGTGIWVLKVMPQHFPKAGMTTVNLKIRQLTNSARQVS